MGKTITCHCGVVEQVDSDSLRTECFKHHISGVSFNWVGGGGYGRAAFHNRTIGEAVRETIGETPSDDVEYVGRRWV